MRDSTTFRARTGLRVATAWVIAGALAGFACAKDADLKSLTATHFKETAQITDDAAADRTTVSTEPGYSEHAGPLRMVWSDEYLQGVIDKKTGKSSFQVRAWVIYSGALRSYRTATYPTADGPRTVETIPLGTEEANCAVGDCTYTERVAFPIEESVLRQLAAGSQPTLWPFTLKPKSGAVYAGRLSTAEIAGFLAKVDEVASGQLSAAVSAAHGSGAAGVSSAPRASPSADLGIEGVPVAAAAERPDRLGVLIVAVKNGSVAHRAGLIVGDIVYEFDGHPIRALADLQSAVARSAANSSVPLRVYRGTDTMALTAHF